MTGAADARLVRKTRVAQMRRVRSMVFAVYYVVLFFMSGMFLMSRLRRYLLPAMGFPNGYVGGRTNVILGPESFVDVPTMTSVQARPIPPDRGRRGNGEKRTVPRVVSASAKARYSYASRKPRAGPSTRDSTAEKKQNWTAWSQYSHSYYKQSFNSKWSDNN
jgi:hypothetical protein